MARTGSRRSRTERQAWSLLAPLAALWHLGGPVRATLARSAPSPADPRLHLHQRDLRHRAARRRRRSAVALGAGRLAARAAALGFRLGNLLRLRGDRSIEILEGELVSVQLILCHDDAHVATVLELAEQHLVGER